MNQNLLKNLKDEFGICIWVPYFPQTNKHPSTPKEQPNIPAQFPQVCYSSLWMRVTGSFGGSLLCRHGGFKGLQHWSKLRTIQHVVVDPSTRIWKVPFSLVHFGSVDEPNDSALFLKPVHPAFRNGCHRLHRLGRFSKKLRFYHAWGESQNQQASQY